MLVVGGGIIGLEMATRVSPRSAARSTVVEMLDQLMPGADPDLVKPLAEAPDEAGYDGVHLKTKVVEGRRRRRRASR